MISGAGWHPGVLDAFASGLVSLGSMAPGRGGRFLFLLFQAASGSSVTYAPAIASNGGLEVEIWCSGLLHGEGARA